MGGHRVELGEEAQGDGLVGHVRRSDAELFAEGIGKVEMRLSKKGN